MTSSDAGKVKSKIDRVFDMFKVILIVNIFIGIVLVGLIFRSDTKISELENTVKAQGQLFNVGTWMRYNGLKLNPSVCLETFGHSFIKQPVNIMDGNGEKHIVPEAFLLHCQLCGSSGYTYRDEWCTLDELKKKLSDEGISTINAGE